MKKLKLIIGFIAAAFVSQALIADKKPNFIIFLVDDLGYNDLSCYGSKNVKTPNLDDMAAKGIQFTSGYVGAPVCGPSRSAIMTGSYPIRIGEPRNLKQLHTEPHTKELFIPEFLKTEGYSTACFGKWHMGHNDKNMPLDQGFDEYWGTITHNGTKKVLGIGPDIYIYDETGKTDVVIDQPLMDKLTTIYTEKSIDFIKRNKDKPFFLYLAHNMTHVTLGVSEKYRDKSGKGLFYDAVMELDWSIGEIRKTLEEEGLAENTVIVFLSDNGPWVEAHLKDPKGNHYGSAFPLRGAKMMPWEGGHRVPYIMQYKGVIPEGQVCDEIVESMDLYATFAKLSGAKLPEDLIIDGRDILPLAKGEVKNSPHDYYYYYCYTKLFAIRDAEWKLVFPRAAKPKFMGWWARMITEVKTVELYNLKDDIGETKNVAKDHPEVVERLMKQAEYARETLGDFDRIGTEVRAHDDSEPKENRLNYAERDVEAKKYAPAKKTSAKKTSAKGKSKKKK